MNKRDPADVFFDTLLKLRGLAYKVLINGKFLDETEEVNRKIWFAQFFQAGADGNFSLAQCVNILYTELELERRLADDFKI